ncbi:SCO3242 family prenyltransferase [Streptomyces sp. NPDC057638]|uniref:SCO3242 family prenyltransferase n=1 Tax=Streptomyces sp. NPDC057638 TaxID=3346190 RepID=UPI0036893A7C
MHRLTRHPRATTADARAPLSSRVRAWAELLRVSALVSVPGDALAGAAALRLPPNRGTLLALGTSLCLYEAGMALNDWADRDEDARERPHRPIPSGRITPAAALTAATTLTATGLLLAARAGRPALTVATALATTVWAYDLHLKHTRWGPGAMGTARTLDVLLGATATARPTRTGASATGPATPAPTLTTTTTASAVRAAVPAALTLGTHTYALTAVSRHETQGGSTLTPLAALATTLALAAHSARPPRRHPTRPGPGDLLPAHTAAAYLRTAVAPYLHATLNPSPQLTQQAVGGGIRALIPLQATLAGRAGHPAGHATAAALIGLAPLARALTRKVSPT